MKTMTFSEWNAACLAQGVSRAHIAVKCCMCGTVQSMADLIAAGAGKIEAEVEKYLGYSCIGRFTGAGAHLRGDAPGNGCDWALGGLLKLHTLEVIHGDRRIPAFEPATPEEAQANMRGEPQKFTAITPAHLHILQHSIGADQHGRIVRGDGRNHFVTGEGSKDYPLCTDLVAVGLMTRRDGSAISGGDDIFHVTATGKQYVAERSPAPPKLTRAQRRYQEFLDADSSMRFGEWLNSPYSRGLAHG